jgi:hypothetical protein
MVRTARPLVDGDASSVDNRGLPLTPDQAPIEASAGSGSRLRPWMIACAGFVFAVSILAAETLDRRLSTDVFWQMEAGQWMLAHHTVIGLDPFSYTETHRHWVADEWGSEVILASLYKVFGAAAYNIIAIVTGALSVGATMLYARTLGAKGARLASIAVVVGLALIPFVTQDRGLSFSLILLPVELLILIKARTSPAWLWSLPVLCLVWVNLHGSVFIGLCVLAAELAWSWAPARAIVRLDGVGQSSHRRWLAMALVSSTLATGITPYGPRLMVYDVHLILNPNFGQYIAEFQSPDFHSIAMYLLFLPALGIMFLAFRQRTHFVLESTLTAVFFLAALHSVRVIPYLVIAAAGLAATLPAGRRPWGERARLITGAVGIGLMVVVVAIPSVPAGSVSTDTPIQAFNYLATHPGRVFTQYEWADYSIARHRATFVDGRNDLFMGTVLNDYFAVSQLKTDPDPIFTKWDVAYVVWARSTPLAEYLDHDPRWHVVDRTPQALIFGRTAS